MLNKDTYPITNHNVIRRSVQGEMVLVMPITGKIEVLNEVGAYIWSLMDGTRNIEEIIHLICDQYDTVEKVAETDVFVFLDQLLERHMIILKTPPVN